MATLTTTKQAAAETPRARLDRARAAEQAANRVLSDRRADVSAAWRAAQFGADTLAKLKGEAALPQLRVGLAEAEIAAESAKQARLDAEGPHKESRVEHYKPLVREAVRKLDEALEQARLANAELQTLGLQARSDSARDAYDIELSWGELGDVDAPSRDCRLLNWRTRIAKYGWR